MKTWMMVGLSALLFVGHYSQGQIDPLTKEDVASLDTAERSDWKIAIEKVYKPKEEEIRLMKERGLSWPQMAIVAQMAKSSKKSIAEVMSFRDGRQMGWSQMAAELKLDDKAIAKEVAKVRKDLENNKYLPPKKPRKKKPGKLDKKEAPETKAGKGGATSEAKKSPSQGK